MKALDPLAVPLRGTNLIEASAGTGKTYMIATLYPRFLLESELQAGQILVVTYTNAATAELRVRIRRRLRDTLRALESGQPSGDETLDGFVRARVAQRAAEQDRRRLLEALRSFDEAAIFTIHGFCQRMLQENAFESGVAFNAELRSDETILCKQVVHDFWTRELHAASELLIHYLVDQNVSPEGLSALALRVTEDPLLWVLPERLEVDLAAAESSWRAARDAAAALWQRCREEVIELLATSPTLNRNRYRVESIRNSWPGEMDRALTGPLPGLFADLKKWTNAELANSVKKDQAPPGHEFFDLCDQLVKAETQLRQALDRRLVRLWLDLTAYVRREFQRRKEDAQVLSFSDLLYRLRRALAGANGELLAERIRSRFRAALIDEFQDTDPVQYEIFHRIYHGFDAPLFLIGDPKQAIYAFRGADVFAYRTARSDAGKTYTLRVNRRSGPTLLRAVNTIFERARQQFLLEWIRYIRLAAPSSAADQLGGTAKGKAPFEILFVPRNGSEGRGEPITKGWLKRMLPGLVAGELVAFLRSGATIGDRPVAPEDVAVLCRTNDQARWMQAALRAVGVPSVLHSEASVFDTAEAAELERVLRAIAQPSDSRALRAALATSVFGLDAGALRALNENEEHWEEWVQRFHAWHELWLRRGFMTAFRRMFEEHATMPRLLALVDGERRVTNFLHLGELVASAAAEMQCGPLGLVRWLTWMRNDPAGREGLGADAAQIRLESDEKAVQLITIHKSKGLEYPVVYCPYLWDGRLLGRGDSSWVRFHDPADNYWLKLDVGSDNHAEHVAQAELEARAENLRLLYVALTRARHRCTVVWGAFKNSENSPLGYLFHQPRSVPAGDDLAARTRERIRELSDEEMMADLEHLAAAARGAIKVREISFAPGAQYRQEPREEAALRCRTFARTLGAHWRVSSFSGLLAETQEHAPAEDAEGPAPDEPVGPGEAALAVLPKPAATMPLADFPTGAEAGLLLHKIFEEIDFCREDPGELPSVVGETLRKYSFEPRWQSPLCQAVDNVLTTPLDESDERFALGRVPRSRRLNEMEFLFPVASSAARAAPLFDVARLTEVFARHASPPIRTAYLKKLRQLDFAPLTGYLRGFIDLVFEDQERWYVVDYKSNLLGVTPDDYLSERLTESMAAHHYFLQYHLYVVALHRYLMLRLPDYDYEHHFGGVYYLFLRGMSPAHPRGCGIFYDRPEQALIEGLSNLLSPREG